MQRSYAVRVTAPPTYSLCRQRGEAGASPHTASADTSAYLGGPQASFPGQADVLILVRRGEKKEGRRTAKAISLRRYQTPDGGCINGREGGRTGWLEEHTGGSSSGIVADAG